MKALRVPSWIFLAATSLVASASYAQTPTAKPPAGPAVRLTPGQGGPTRKGAEPRTPTPTPPPAGTTSGATPPPPPPPPPAGPTGPGAPATTPAPKQGDTNTLPQFPEEVEFVPRPPGYRVAFSLEDASLSELVRVISQLTGKRFIFGGKVRDIKATVYSPQKVTVAEAYRAFLAILETNGLTVIPQGRFLKIVETPGVVQNTTPIYGVGQPVPPEDRYVTRLYRLQHVDADEVGKLLTKFKSKEADVTVYGPGNLLIITDTASNIRRSLRLIEEVDVGGAADQIWVEKVNYAVATEIAQKLQEIFDIKGGGGKGGGAAPGGPDAAGGGKGSESDTRISKIIAEERTNSLIVVATERAYLRILEVIKRLDVAQTGAGDIHVLTLQHAMAEELSQVLNNILTGMGAGKGAAPGGARPGGAGPAEGVFEGTVKITADKATNSLVITSSLRDYAALRTVIDQLDHARRQVFIEAVIMDLSVDHSTKIGVNYHVGAAPDLGIGGGNSLIYGGLNPLTSILLPTPDQLQGLALGVRGPGIEGSTNLLGTGLTVPAFGVVINALATSGDANVLATPHIIATDNVPAEISVGENIPLQTNLGGGMGGIPGLGTTGTTGTPALGGLGMMGGFGMGGFAAPRQDVGTKIKVVPHINDSMEVRLELTEEISERGASSGALGVVSITKRTANTTVVVHDQQTVVIGGLMRDAFTSSQKKVPVLGDIPLLGFLFRSSEMAKRKTNLLLVLTPYIIRDQGDLRTIFERKMQERQEFLDRYFVFSDQKKYEPPKDFSRTNGLLEDIRQSMLDVIERKRLAEEAKPKLKSAHEPGQPIEWVPTGSGDKGGGDAPKGGAASTPPPGGAAPAAEPSKRPSPVIVSPMNRSVSGDNTR
ncbi:MAG: type II secretion system secretin GspD [Deltaproteobacteria bacterium]|nr:type II secretion system secretin GspD [Deltaproteobacteria bacterium]